jgi:acyl-CoA thioester hydrolase
MDDPFTVPMEVRFRDIDSMGHVNNAVYATYLEQAPVRDTTAT